MAWLGKLVGGTMGFFLGGPLGLIAGVAFGNLFDSADRGRGERSSISSSDQTQMVFLLEPFQCSLKWPPLMGLWLLKKEQKWKNLLQKTFV